LPFESGKRIGASEALMDSVMGMSFSGRRCERPFRR
jgi:hypothetical protein